MFAAFLGLITNESHAKVLVDTCPYAEDVFAKVKDLIEAKTLNEFNIPHTRADGKTATMEELFKDENGNKFGINYLMVWDIAGLNFVREVALNAQKLHHFQLMTFNEMNQHVRKVFWTVKYSGFDRDTKKHNCLYIARDKEGRAIGHIGLVDGVKFEVK